MTPEGNRMDQRLADLPAEVLRDLDSETLQYVASRALVWEVRLMYEPERDRYSFHLPEEARMLQVLPEEGQTAVILAVQDILYIWPAKEWLAYTRDGLERLETLREAAARSLPLREENEDDSRQLG